MNNSVIVLLFSAACSSADPQRADVRTGSDTVGESTAQASRGSNEEHELVRNNYDVAHEICGHKPDDIYRQAGTRSIHEAAEWYSRIFREGAHRTASYRGCADALMGKEKSF